MFLAFFILDALTVLRYTALSVAAGLARSVAVPAFGLAAALTDTWRPAETASTGIDAAAPSASGHAVRPGLSYAAAAASAASASTGSARRRGVTAAGAFAAGAAAAAAAAAAPSSALVAAPSALLRVPSWLAGRLPRQVAAEASQPASGAAPTPVAGSTPTAVSVVDLLLGTVPHQTAHHDDSASWCGARLLRSWNAALRRRVLRAALWLLLPLWRRASFAALELGNTWRLPRMMTRRRLASLLLLLASALVFAPLLAGAFLALAVDPLGSVAASTAVACGTAATILEVAAHAATASAAVICTVALGSAAGASASANSRLPSEYADKQSSSLWPLLSQPWRHLLACSPGAEAPAAAVTVYSALRNASAASADAAASLRSYARASAPWLWRKSVLQAAAEDRTGAVRVADVLVPAADAFAWAASSGAVGRHGQTLTALDSTAAGAAASGAVGEALQLPPPPQSSVLISTFPCSVTFHRPSWAKSGTGAAPMTSHMLRMTSALAGLADALSPQNAAAAAAVAAPAPVINNTAHSASGGDAGGASAAAAAESHDFDFSFADALEHAAWTASSWPALAMPSILARNDAVSVPLLYTGLTVPAAHVVLSHANARAAIGTAAAAALGLTQNAAPGRSAGLPVALDADESAREVAAASVQALRSLPVHAFALEPGHGCTIMRRRQPPIEDESVTPDAAASSHAAADANANAGAHRPETTAGGAAGVASSFAPSLVTAFGTSPAGAQGVVSMLALGGLFVFLLRLAALEGWLGYRARLWPEGLEWRFIAAFSTRAWHRQAAPALRTLAGVLAMTFGLIAATAVCGGLLIRGGVEQQLALRARATGDILRAAAGRGLDAAQVHSLLATATAASARHSGWSVNKPVLQAVLHRMAASYGLPAENSTGSASAPPDATASATAETAASAAQADHFQMAASVTRLLGGNGVHAFRLATADADGGALPAVTVYASALDWNDFMDVKEAIELLPSRVRPAQPLQQQDAGGDARSDIGASEVAESGAGTGASTTGAAPQLRGMLSALLTVARSPAVIPILRMMLRVICSCFAAAGLFVALLLLVNNGRLVDSRLAVQYARWQEALRRQRYQIGRALADYPESRRAADRARRAAGR